MKIYYHFYPTCPACHEPHVSGATLERSGNDLKCSSCGAHFRKGVDLVSSGKFSKTVDAVIRSEGERARNELTRIPLLWEVRPNIVEDGYIRWLRKIEKGRFLITWPWKEVKFIPLLLSEYLLNNPDKKAVVVGEVAGNSDRDETGVPAINEVYNSLIYLESPETDDIGREFREEMKKLDWKCVFLKKKVVHYLIKEVGSRGHRTEDICIDTLTKCKNKLIKEIKLDFGEKSIRCVTRKINSEWRKKTLNTDGFIDIKLDEREQWMGKKLNYKKQWLWNVLLNSRKIRRLSRMIPAASLKDPESVRTGSERLFFISSEMEPQIIFSLIESIRPHLLIIQNVDDFMKDAVFGGDRSRALFDFLTRSRNFLILMFSTNPDVRYLYGINCSGEYVEDYSVDNYDIIPHTWDSEIIVEKIKSRLEKGDYGYPNPVSSRFEELHSIRRVPELEYIRIDSLDELEDLLEEVTPLVDDSLRSDVKRYIYDLRKTPLLVMGDYTRPEVFRRRGRVSGHEITYDYLISLIHEVCDEERFKKIKGSIDRIYRTESGPINPIMEKMSEKISELLQNEDNSVTVVVHRYDIRGTEKLLRSLGYGDYIPQKLAVCSWSDLSQRERELGENTGYYVLSTLPPSFEYPMSSSRVRKIIFVGGRRFTEKIETIIKHRLAEQARRPLYLLTENDPAPVLLREILKDVEIPSNETIRNLTDEIIVEFEGSISRSCFSAGKAGTYHPAIKPGEKALLVVDAGGNGVFIPEGTSLLVRADGKLSELEIGDISSDKKLPRELTGKEILLDRRGLYSSFRADFIKFMMDYGKKVTFRKGPYTWSGFHSLFSDAIQWIDIIRRAINEHSYRKKIPYEVAENKISEYLSSLDLTAKDPGYIRSWWNRYEVILTESGSYNLYRVEHPKSPDDLVRIYKGISGLLSEVMIDPADALKCYAASIVIQHFRRSLLKGKIKDISPSLRGLYNRLEDKIKNIVEESETFKVNLAYTVEITKEIEPFRVIENYGDYFRAVR